ncbi:hypothetical protein COT07_03925 [Candidatus Woesearchaeota archaeon CG07_land_8_20_14_0_80_44_23]|nr:MAG: hypothetical protein COT07_03925 [Candidatus Woesearchaeota archaeon CG07_land_8_20_14_0_80_44_23]
MIFGLAIIVIAILAAAIILSIFLKVARIFVGIIFAAATLIIVGLLVSGFFVLRDFQDFTAHSADSQYYLRQGDNIVAGFTQPNETGAFSLMGAAELNNATASFAKKDYPALKGSHYKLFIVDYSKLKSGNAGNVSVEFAGKNFSGEFAVGLLGSEEPKAYLFKLFSKPEIALIDANFLDSSEMKSQFFMSYLSSAMKADPLFMIKGISSGSIKVYPETPMFFAIRIMPISLAKGFVSEALKKGSSTLSKVV